MWRRGEQLYALLVLLVVALEAYALGALVILFSARLLGQAAFAQLQAGLLQILALTALLLVLLGAYVLAYHVYSSPWRRRERTTPSRPEGGQPRRARARSAAA